jgi:hypothetical protein
MRLYDRYQQTGARIAPSYQYYWLGATQALARAGAEAVRLLLGTVPMLVVAGIIEAFISPTDLAVSWKFSMATALFILLVVYLFRPIPDDIPPEQSVERKIATAVPTVKG